MEWVVFLILLYKYCSWGGWRRAGVGGGMNGSGVGVKGLDRGWGGWRGVGKVFLKNKILFLKIFLNLKR